MDEPRVASSIAANEYHTRMAVHRVGANRLQLCIHIVVARLEPVLDGSVKYHVHRRHVDRWLGRLIQLFV